MDINASELTEVLTIVNQYEKDAYIFTDRKDILRIDGLQAAKQMTQYEKSVLAKCGFGVSNTDAIFQLKPKVEKTKE